MNSPKWMFFVCGIFALATSMVRAAEVTKTLQARDEAGRHSIVIRSQRSPVGDSVEFEYKLIGQGACTYRVVGIAKQVSAEDKAKVGVDWNQFLPDGQSVPFARFLVEGNRAASLEVDVKSSPNPPGL